MFFGLHIFLVLVLVLIVLLMLDDGMEAFVGTLELDKILVNL